MQNLVILADSNIRILAIISPYRAESETEFEYIFTHFGNTHLLYPVRILVQSIIYQ